MSDLLFIVIFLSLSVIGTCWAADLTRYSFQFFQLQGLQQCGCCFFFFYKGRYEPSGQFSEQFNDEGFASSKGGCEFIISAGVKMSNLPLYIQKKTCIKLLIIQYQTHSCALVFLRRCMLLFYGKQCEMVASTRSEMTNE